MGQRIVKSGFNGGRIAPHLHWSPDLPLHSRACKEMVNWLPETNGSCTRRFGGKQLWELGPQYSFTSNEAVRKVKFQFGQNAFDIVYLHTDTTVPPVSIPGRDPIAITIINQSGKIVKEFPSTDTPWSERDLNNLFTLQSSDVLFIFSGTQPIYTLTRTSETEWELDQYFIKGGPWKIGNGDRNQIIKGSIEKYDAGTSYNEGDIVIDGASQALTGVSANVLYNTRFEGARLRYEVRSYYTRIFTTSAPLVEAGDLVRVRGAVAGAAGDLNGEWRVARKDATANWIDLHTGTEFFDFPAGGQWVNDYSGNALGSASIDLNGQRQAFYTAKNSGILGAPASTPDDWQQSSYLTGNITLKSTNDLWSSTDVGRQWRIASDERPRIFGSFSSTEQGAFSEAMPAIGQVTLTTEGGVWAGELVLQLSLDNGISWQDIAAITSDDGERNGTVTRTISDFGGLVRAYMRERRAAGLSTDTGCKYHIELDDPQYTYFVIDQYISPTEVKAYPLNPMPSVPNSWRWNEWAFGGDDGYPATGAILNDALIVSGVAGEPGRIWFSNTGNWDIWTTGGYVGASFDLLIGKNTRNIVQWMQANDELLVGTDAGEWSVSRRDTDLVLSLTNYKLDRQAEYGSSSVPALSAGNVIIYVEVDSFRVRALERNVYDRGSFNPSDISIQVPDWFQTSEVIQLAYSRSPIPIIWVLMADNRLFSWTFDPANQVTAWAEHSFAGVDKIFSIEVTPTGEGDSLLVTALSGTRVIELVCSFENEVLDNYQTFSPEFGIVYPFSGSTPPIAYDGAYIEHDILYSAEGSSIVPKIIELASIPVDLRIRIDGTITTDYTRLEGSSDLYVYLPYGSGAITVYDGPTLLVDGVDYTIVDGGDCTVATLFPAEGFGVPSPDWADYTFEDSGGTPITDYVIFSDSRYMLFFNRNYSDIVIKKSGNVQTRGYDYRVQDLRYALSFPTLPREGIAYVGYLIDNLLWPTDLLANFQLGGPGGVVSYKEIDFLVYETLGLQVRAYQGYDDPDEEEWWTEVPDTTPDAPVGVAQPLYTGVQRFGYPSNVQYNGVDLQIRAYGPRRATIGSMAVNVERSK